MGAICQAMTVDVWLDSLFVSSQVIDAQEFHMTDNVKLQNVREAQRQDPVIDRLLPFVMNGKQPKPGQLPLMKVCWNHLCKEGKRVIMLN